MQTHPYFYASKPRRSNPGHLSPLIDCFVFELQGSGYAIRSIDKHVQSVAHFGEWLQIGDIEIDAIDDDVIFRFGLHSCDCPSRKVHKPVSARELGRIVRFIEFLRQQRILVLSPEAKTSDDCESVRMFGSWLATSRGLSPVSVDSYKRAVATLLPLLGDDPGAYDVATVRRVVQTVAKDCGLCKTKSLCTALRSYLRYLAGSGLCQSVLVDAVPTVPHWRLSSLPRYITPAELQRVTRVWIGPDCRSLRNRAVILLLARLGLRARDIVTLRIDDIDWCEAALHVTGKTRRPARLPLPQDVGDAIWDYLECGRPRLAIPEVFLRLRPPHGPLRSSSTVSSMVDLTLKLAGIEDPPARGANLLRHSAATAMLREGATLDEVATILRHRSKDMTAHYAKVDVDALQKLAQAWPESGLC